VDEKPDEASSDVLGSDGTEGLFADDMIEVIEDTEEDVGLSGEFLKTEKVTLGGGFSAVFPLTGSWVSSYPDFTDLGDGYKESFLPSIDANLFFNARPEDDFRVFGKVKTSYPFVKEYEVGVQTVTVPDIRIFELFSDFDYKDRIFFRVGKQTVKWGVGYFYSPADVLSLAQIDPEDPEAEREGPIAVKAHLPIDIHNLYLYLIMKDDIESIDEVAAAARFEYVLGRFELGLGGYYRSDLAPKLMATFSGSAGKFGVFGEAMASYGSDKTFVRQTTPTAWEAYEQDDEVFFSGTLGFSWIKSDPNLSVYAQYLFKGDGYTDNDMLKDIRKDFLSGNTGSYSSLILQGLSSDSLFGASQHYAALAASWSEIGDSDFSLSLLVQVNLADFSGLVIPALTFAPIDYASFKAELKVAYGEEGSEFASLGRSAFSLRYPGGGQFLIF
jgi:hypothetical protein